MYAGHHSKWIDVKIKFVEWMGLSLGTHFPDDQLSKFMHRFQPGAIVPSLNHVTPLTHSKGWWGRGCGEEGLWLTLSPPSREDSAARPLDRNIRPWTKSSSSYASLKNVLTILMNLYVRINSKRIEKIILTHTLWVIFGIIQNMALKILYIYIYIYMQIRSMTW